MLSQILVIFLLFLPACQGKVCGYEVRMKSRTERVPYLQTVVCQTAGCPEESRERGDVDVSSNLKIPVRHSDGDQVEDQADPCPGGSGEMLCGL